MLTQQELKKYLRYDQETGMFSWVKLPHHLVGKLNQIAGSLNDKGYWVIGLNRIKYKAHRLAWLYVYGAWPNEELDHINGLKDDNRICNLREATHRENMQNLKNSLKNNVSGFLGVGFNKAFKNNKYVAQIGKNGKIKFLGSFKTPLEAHRAYLTAKRMEHEFCTI